MIVNTRGVVIKQTKFSDSGVIVKIFTEQYGMQSFFVRGLKSRKSKSKAAMFQPLSILDLVINFSDKKSLQTIKDIDLAYSYKSIPDNMVKRSVLFFIVELLYKCLKDEVKNKELFDWINGSLVWLDIANEGYANFHLLFMMQLTKFLGFYPSKLSMMEISIFDLQDGQFTNTIPLHGNYLSGDEVNNIMSIYSKSFEDATSIKFNRENRMQVLENLIKYYNFHIPSMGGFKSLEILSVILD
ncbi:MAG: DNA repair protein RecO [Lentimicrobiaceae bacterium]|jgi:DNA repair protein RecO (recombination protein O)|nr:DNA repair protein RecO [Lentimicrobiaceae bacterium]MCP4910908.1 DNA repair protein RecO [Bacteroidota bacterium]MBT3455341.1 DNA repair protein RecO [Lentimicrobiaceae bacterium]MBT3818819.1 DNA repair protein RecO [Lentimicrobiaceae bacterium]MBT4062086.1 DNA repair protein RecO [Lentimicrobiaceae bacterium]